MDPQITGALIALGATVIGALGTLVKLLIDRLAADIAANTQLTTQARDAANGQLSIVVEQLAASRNQVMGLRAIIRERDDRIAYIVARHPEVEATIHDYRDRRTSHATEQEEMAALQRIVDEADEH